MKFTFSVPLWGDWHVFTYLKHTLASHAAAELEGEYIVHTTKLGKRMLYGKIEHELPRCRVKYIEVQPEASYFQFSKYHQEAFDGSEACIFLQADAIISNGTFKAIRRAVDAGAKHVNCAGINCIDDGSGIPFDSSLNAWAVAHLIPTLAGNIWTQDGRDGENMMSPQTMFFRDGDAFWCHAFHHDPICMVNDHRGVNIVGSTLDWISPSFFSPAETAVLSGHEALVVEASPPHKFDRHPRHTILNATEIALQVRDKVLPAHVNLFAHPVPIIGEPTAKFDQLISDVLALMTNAEFYGDGKRKAA
jgi:hypothetical protein